MKRPFKEFYRDVYGCTASIYRRPDYPVVNLTVCDGHGNTIIRWRQYRTYRGAKIALGRMSDGWTMTGKEIC